ncbi:WhiB family transcriptional regulator [Kitasatospora griseola]|uniref:Transcriptional regulator WhiB n=1 Tax=Kitasatospora griseola TaxID=2064 RepID=A0A0D0P1J8_KITGR|nr:WhiB family transcriptional regulator [Kitasatospora griseola]KIQ65496.1 WhiB family transcriptional regulator [Kitasatospora griseola]
MTVISRLPGATEEQWDWQLRGACRAADSRLFFHPPGERGRAHEDRDRAAKAVCARCPVRERCLRHALAARERYGVWGGRTEEERQHILRRRRRNRGR